MTMRTMPLTKLYFYKITPRCKLNPFPSQVVIRPALISLERTCVRWQKILSLAIMDSQGMCSASDRLGCRQANEWQIQPKWVWIQSESKKRKQKCLHLAIINHTRSAVCGLNDQTWKSLEWLLSNLKLNSNRRRLPLNLKEPQKICRTFSRDVPGRHVSVLLKTEYLMAVRLSKIPPLTFVSI